jgi:hypothetical protein
MPEGPLWGRRVQVRPPRTRRGRLIPLTRTRPSLRGEKGQASAKSFGVSELSLCGCRGKRFSALIYAVSVCGSSSIQGRGAC